MACHCLCLGARDRWGGTGGQPDSDGGAEGHPRRSRVRRARIQNLGEVRQIILQPDGFHG